MTQNAFQPDDSSTLTAPGRDEIDRRAEQADSHFAEQYFSTPDVTCQDCGAAIFNWQVGDEIIDAEASNQRCRQCFEGRG